MRIGSYNTHTGSGSLKSQEDEEKGTKRISGFGYQKDSNGTQKSAKYLSGIKKSDANNGWDYKNIAKYDENGSIKEGLNEYSDSLDVDSNGLIELTNGTVIDILNYEEGDKIDTIETDKFGLINFSNELNKYTVARNKEFFEILDKSIDIEIKMFDGKIDSSTLIYVDTIIDGKRRAEAITLASLSRLLLFKGDNYDNHLQNFKNSHGFNISKVIKGRKKIKRHNNINMSHYNDVA